MIILKDVCWEIVSKLQREVGRSEEVEGLAAAAQGAEVEILVRERNFGNRVKGPLHSTLTLLGDNDNLSYMKAVY